MDSLTLNGNNVTGLLNGKGDSIWFGLDGLSYNPFFLSNGIVLPNQFSTKGLRHFVENNGVDSFRKNNSAIPSDTIQAAAYSGGDSLWIAGDSGLFVFIPPSKIRKVTQLKGLVVTTMKADTLGRLYVGTRRGLYVLDNDSLKILNYPTVAVRKVLSKHNMESGPILSVQIIPGNGMQKSLSNLTGRKNDHKLAAGIFVKTDVFVGGK